MKWIGLSLECELKKDLIIYFSSIWSASIYVDVLPWFRIIRWTSSGPTFLLNNRFHLKSQLQDGRINKIFVSFSQSDFIEPLNHQISNNVEQNFYGLNWYLIRLLCSLDSWWLWATMFSQFNFSAMVAKTIIAKIFRNFIVASRWCTWSQWFSTLFNHIRR